MFTRQDIANARAAAVARRRGEEISFEETRLIAAVVDEIGPESFYMDGELFAEVWV
jgi:hypothetical protein